MQSAWSILLAVLMLAIAGQTPALSFAQQNDRPQAERLKKFYEVYSSGRYPEARKRGEELLRSRLSPNEIGTVERVLADIAQNEERWADAREHLRHALASGGLSDLEADAARYQIARLFWQEERWQEGIDAWHEWSKSALAPPSAGAHYDLARAYFQLEDFVRALDPARKAVEVSKQPNAQILRLLVAIQLRREAYADAAPLLRTLAGMEPEKRESWVQLAAVYAQLGSEAEAAQSMQIAYYDGLLLEKRDLELLAQLLVQIGIPYRAARILSAAIESKSLVPDAKLYRSLGEIWIVAQEYRRAIEPLTLAAGLSDDGDLYVRVAELQAQLEDWPQVVAALRLALDKGRLDDPCRAQLLLGVALYRQGKPRDARRWLERTLECPGSRDSAQGLLHLLDSETVGDPRVVQ